MLHVHGGNIGWCSMASEGLEFHLEDEEGKQWADFSSPFLWPSVEFTSEGSHDPS